MRFFRLTLMCVLRHFVDHTCELRLEVRSFVHVDDVAFSQFVEHRAYFRQSLCSCSFVSSLAQVAHSVTSCFSVIVVVCFACCRLANTLQRAFMICHLCCFFVSDSRTVVLLFRCLERIGFGMLTLGRSCSAKGNRTPIARMKILSTNRYTMAPGGVPVNRGNRLPPEGASQCLFTKAAAKVLLFFDIRKYFCIFLLFYAIFQQNKPINTPVRAVPGSE